MGSALPYRVVQCNAVQCSAVKRSPDIIIVTSIARNGPVNFCSFCVNFSGGCFFRSTLWVNWSTGGLNLQKNKYPLAINAGNLLASQFGFEKMY